MVMESLRRFVESNEPLKHLPVAESVERNSQASLTPK
jgi:hypothetical protein